MSHPRTILAGLGANALKSFSQNFLTSPHWADRLTDAVLAAGELDEVWEIGPGLGALTARLLEKTTLPVRAFEIDRKLSAYLRETHPRLALHEGDVLEADFAAIAPDAKRVGLLSNLPYQLSSPILFKLIDHKPRFARLVLTFQKEYAERLVAGPGKADYGALSVVIQSHFSLDSLGVLPPGAFYPAPGVSSQALIFTPREGVAPNLSQVVRAAFQQRRKKLSSNLKEAFPEAPIDSLMAGLGLASDIRPEALSKETYAELAAALVPYPAKPLRGA